MHPAWLTQRPIAHRGLHDIQSGLVENSASAMRASIRRGFALEVDLRLAADGGIIVFHDETLSRLCGIEGRVKDYPLPFLEAQSLAGGPDKILSLKSLLALVGGLVPLFVELKSEGARDGRLESGVATHLAAYEGPVAAMSFDPSCLLRLKQKAPHISLGIIADAKGEKGSALAIRLRRFASRHLLAAPFVRPDFIAYDFTALPSPIPRLLRALGLPLLAWTVRSPAERKTALRHADQIIFEHFDPDALA